MLRLSCIGIILLGSNSEVSLSQHELLTYKKILKTLRGLLQVIMFGDIGNLSPISTEVVPENWTVG